MADHDDHIGHGPGGPGLPAPDPFVALRRGVRRHDARWYYACRLRSFGPRALQALQYADVYAMGPVVPGRPAPAAERPGDDTDGR